MLLQPLLTITTTITTTTVAEFIMAVVPILEDTSAAMMAAEVVVGTEEEEEVAVVATEGARSTGVWALVVRAAQIRPLQRNPSKRSSTLKCVCELPLRR